MNPEPPAAPAEDWEKRDAPRVTRGHVALASIVYGVWMAFLAVVAFKRWYGVH